MRVAQSCGRRDRCTCICDTYDIREGHSATIIRKLNVLEREVRVRDDNLPGLQNMSALHPSEQGKGAANFPATPTTDCLVQS